MKKFVLSLSLILTACFAWAQPDPCSDCDGTFDPVCAEIAPGDVIVFPNACIAECLGFTDHFVCDSTVIVNPPYNPDCDAFFSYSVHPDNPLEVQFDDLSTGDPISWSWDFGDGNVSADQNPSHTYADKGIYEVQLDITTDSCTSTYLEHICLFGGIIVFPSDSCNCPMIYDPVCVIDPAIFIAPFDNACLAECAGFLPGEYISCDSIGTTPPNPCNCTFDFEPVCVEVDSGYIITFPNPCLAECEGYTSDDFVDCDSIGTPPNPCNCPMIYDPVCVIDPAIFIAPFDNACLAECAGFLPGEYISCDSIGTAPPNPCNCNDILDPVCVEVFPGAVIPFPNACWAECSGYNTDDFVNCDSVIIIQNSNDFTTITQEGDFEVNVHPNPPINNVNVHIVTQINGEAHVKLMDLSGRIVHNNSTTVVKGFNKRTIDVSSLESGIYFLQVQQDDQIKTMKLVKP